jgi:hypothetical protein
MTQELVITHKIPSTRLGTVALHAQPIGKRSPASLTCLLPCRVYIEMFVASNDEILMICSSLTLLSTLLVLLTPPPFASCLPHVPTFNAVQNHTQFEGRGTFLSGYAFFELLTQPSD